MSNPFGGTGGTFSSRPKAAKPASKSDGGSILGKVAGGYLGITGNLLTDVKDAAVGLPMGLVTAVQHPERALKATARQTWHTWSPLFHGNVGTFLHQTYDHPLAPILDVASVLSLGAGGVAKGATIATDTARLADLSQGAKAITTTEKIAKLKMPKAVDLHDPTGARPEIMQKHLSRSPGRRLVQETMLKLDEGGHLPQFYTRARYERAMLSDAAHRVVSKQHVHAEALKQAKVVESAIESNDLAFLGARLQAQSAISGARAVEDITEVGRRAREATYAGMLAGLARHNKAYTLEESRTLLKTGRWGYVVDPAHLDVQGARRIRGAQRAHSRLTRQYSSRLPDWTKRETRLTTQLRDAEAMAQGLARTEADLQKANAQLNEMYRQGYEVAHPARMADGKRIAKNPTERQLIKMESQPIQDIHDRITQLTKQREEALAAKAKAEALRPKLDTVKMERTQLEDRIISSHDGLEAMKESAAANHFAHVSGSYDSLKVAINGFGKAAVAKDINRAMQSSDGRFYMAPIQDSYRLAAEAAGSLGFLHTLLHKPTMIWKSLVVGYTPRTITNNAVGNWFMYAFRNLPNGNGVRAIGDTLRFSFGPKVLDDPVFGHNHFIHRWFTNELADQFGVGNEITRLGADELGGRAKFLSHARQGVYPVVAATAEKPLRVASIYKALRDMPEVQAEIKKLRSRGVTGQVAVDRGIERALNKYPNLQAEVSAQSRRIAGDYVTMSNAEKWARDIIPFYLWDRHILKNTGNMLLEQPARLAVASRISQLGIQETEERLGKIPDFLRGAIPLAALGLGDHTGRANVLLTASLNPYATVGDLAETVNAWTTGKGRRTAALSQFNPYLTEATASIFQVNTLTGGPQPRSGSIIGDVTKGIWNQLPYTKALAQELGPDTRVTPKGNDYLYAKTKTASRTSLLGVPIRDVSLGRAHQLADQLDGTKTKKTKRRSPF